MALEEEREAQLDARLLLEHVCGTSLQTLLLDGERAVTDNEAELYRRLLKRRCSREPLAYILGKWDFMGLEFGVSSDVLIPAFMAAYSGKNAAKIDMNPFPGIKAILPNWRISYDGLGRIPFFKKLFKSFQISHNYSCTYMVDNFTSFSDWVTIGNGLGFTQNVVTEEVIPSSPYSISSVSLREEFLPFFGITATLNNGLTLDAKYNIKRNMSLMSSAGQLTEVGSNELSITANYKIANFNQVLRLKTKQQNVNNDLQLTFGVKLQSNTSLIRKWRTVDQDGVRSIVADKPQPTSGTRTLGINFAANYVISKRITFGAFFDYNANTPLVSTSSYPTTNSNYGIQITMNLVK